MTEREKLALLEDMMELDEGDLTVDKALDDIDEYDSMAKLSLIVLMEDEFGVKLTGDVIKGFETVGDIVALMNK
ncbi:MAG: acyl carrier protein [Clostridia bacterium]|nr:acyl carrier protein [Clostridia bacterium]MBR0143806.1 acyl carrier protein [Clostridia bacterium]